MKHFHIHFTFRWHDLDEVTRSMFEEMADNDKARFQREKAEYNMNPNGRYKHSRFDIFYSCTNKKFLSKGQNGTRTLQNAPCVGSCTSQQRSVERFVGYKHTFFSKTVDCKKTHLFVCSGASREPELCSGSDW